MGMGIAEEPYQREGQVLLWDRVLPYGPISALGYG